MGAVSITVVTRYLGPELYGKYSLALLYTQLFGVVADVGLYTTLVRDISRDPARTEELVGNVLVLRLALAIAVIAVGAGISLALPYDREVRVAIVLAGGPLLFGMLTSSIEAVFQSRLRMTRAVIADVVGRAVALGLVVVVVVARPRLLQRDAGRRRRRARRLPGHLVAHAARCCTCARPPTCASGGPLLAASIPLGVALAINQLYFRADTLIISLYEPYDQVALYTLAYRILELSRWRRHGLPHHDFAGAVAGRRARRGRARSARSSDATESCRGLGAPLVGGRRSSLAPADRRARRRRATSRRPPTPLQILLVAGALTWVNGVFGCRADREGPPGQRAVAERRRPSSSTSG